MKLYVDNVLNLQYWVMVSKRHRWGEAARSISSFLGWGKTPVHDIIKDKEMMQQRLTIYGDLSEAIFTPTITTRYSLSYIMILLNSNIDSVQWQKTYYNAHIVTHKWQPQLMHGSQAIPHRTRRIAHPVGYQNQIHPQCPENRTSDSIPSDLS